MQLSLHLQAQLPTAGARTRLTSMSRHIPAIPSIVENTTMYDVKGVAAAGHSHRDGDCEISRRAATEHRDSADSP